MGQHNEHQKRKIRRCEKQSLCNLRLFINNGMLACFVSWSKGSVNGYYLAVGFDNRFEADLLQLRVSGPLLHRSDYSVGVAAINTSLIGGSKIQRPFE